MRFLTFVALAALLAATSARAQYDDPVQLCAARHTADAIRACTKVVKDFTLPAETRVIALRNRGYSFQLQGDLDKAIGDYDAAIKLAAAGQPRGKAALMLAKTYVDRGVAWREKGDVDKALADFDAALAVAPDLASAKDNRAALFFK